MSFTKNDAIRLMARSAGSLLYIYIFAMRAPAADLVSAYGININPWALAILISIFFHIVSTALARMGIEQSLLQDGGAAEIPTFAEEAMTPERKWTISNETALRVKLREEIMTRLRTKGAEVIVDRTKEIVDAYNNGIAFLSEADVREMRDMFIKLYGHDYFAAIIGAMATCPGTNVSLADINDMMNRCKQAMAAYLQFGQIAVAHFRQDILASTVQEWINAGVDDEQYTGTYGLISSLIGGAGLVLR